ncbi:27239_t:CDS:2, partial [Racocetra persica]
TEYELNLLDTKHIALMPYNLYNPDDRDLRYAGKVDYDITKCYFLLLDDCELDDCECFDDQTEEISGLELKQPYIINYRMAFYINKNQLKIQNFFESWRKKLNNINSILVGKEVLEEIEKNNEFTESIESNYDKWNINKWNIENNPDKILLSYNSIDNIKIDILYAKIKAIKLLKNKDLLMKIVTDNFRTLSQYPEIINWFLSRIAFFVPDDTLYEIVNPNSTSRLTNYPKESTLTQPIYDLLDQLNNIKKIPLYIIFLMARFFYPFDINPFGFSPKTNLYELWIAHLDELRKVVKQIQNNTWPGFYKPYISPVLLEAIQMKSELDHVEDKATQTNPDKATQTD